MQTRKVVYERPKPYNLQRFPASTPSYSWLVSIPMQNINYFLQPSHYPSYFYTMEHENLINEDTLIHNCHNSQEKEVLNVIFRPRQLLRFYLLVLPGFILGAIGIYRRGIAEFILWLVLIALFFGVIEIRVLCSHCPHYGKPGAFLRCWANYGMPRLWRYRPNLMSRFEKVTLLAGFAVVWGFPALYMIFEKNWIFLSIYLFLATGFFVILRLSNCRKCINFSCPLNGVSRELKEAFKQRYNGQGLLQ